VDTALAPSGPVSSQEAVLQVVDCSCNECAPAVMWMPVRPCRPPHVDLPQPRQLPMTVCSGQVSWSQHQQTRRGHTEPAVTKMATPGSLSARCTLRPCCRCVWQQWAVLPRERTQDLARAAAQRSVRLWPAPSDRAAHCRMSASRQPATCPERFAACLEHAQGICAPP
jgi:hypothetical protein